MLRARFADAGWQARRILDAFTADPSDFYLDRVAQVHAPTWSRGRVALVGDAAYCASPISGMGTSLALTGAYVLAGELASHRDHRLALKSYESLLRPYVRKAQRLPPGAPRIANPISRLGLLAFHTALRLAASPRGRGLASRLFTPPADELELPDYTTASADGSPASADGSPASADGSPASADGSPSSADGSPSSADGSPA